ncbi:leucine-rich repeat, cysteine-containing subtype protein [Tanacetum coccineum]
MPLTKVGEEVLDLVIPYIHNVDDRNSVSLVSRKSYEIDGITRKRVTVHTLYYPNLASLNKRFPFIEALTLKGPPSNFNVTDDYDIQITSWIEPLALEFMCLKKLHIRGLVVCDEDLKTLARTCGKDLRTLRIGFCERFSMNGLMHVSKYCNQLRTLCLRYPNYFIVKDGIWLHQLPLNSTVLERYAVRLEHFAGNSWDEKSELVGFQFPPNTRSLSINDLSVTQYSIVVPFLNHIKKLKLAFLDFECECQCLLFERCTNLEVLYTKDVCGDKGLKVIGKFYKKLRKLTHNGLVTNVGLIALEKGCTKLECLKVRLRDISNEAHKEPNKQKIREARNTTRQEKIGQTNGKLKQA